MPEGNVCCDDDSFSAMLLVQLVADARVLARARRPENVHLRE